MAARNINLGELPNGDLILVTDQSFPADIKRVEYYRDQKLFMLVYERDELDSDLMHYELQDSIAQRVERKSNLMIVSPDDATGRKYGYFTSLIQVGA